MSFNRFLIKKIKRLVTKGHTVLHLSAEQKSIQELVEEQNLYTRIYRKEDLETKIQEAKACFSVVIIDTDLELADDLLALLNKLSVLMFKHSYIIIIASNLCSFKNKIAVVFENDLENLKRPYRAVSPGYLRKNLLEHGYKIKNRFWNYGEKLLLICEP